VGGQFLVWEGGGVGGQTKKAIVRGGRGGSCTARSVLKTLYCILSIVHRKLYCEVNVCVMYGVYGEIPFLFASYCLSALWLALSLATSLCAIIVCPCVVQASWRKLGGSEWPPVLYMEAGVGPR
jgi:hypothetical protein